MIKQRILSVVLLALLVVSAGGFAGFSPSNPVGKGSVMILVKEGRFEMGDRQMVGESDEQPLRKAFAKSFYLAQYETTFEEYDDFCKASWATIPEDYGWGRGKRPVVNVSWYDAILYCNWKSASEGYTPCYKIDKLAKDPNNENLQDLDRWTVKFDPAANGYRLPSEAEWEYAARGGQSARNTVGAGSSNVDSVGWYIKNARLQTFPVGQKAPNELGFYDMSGNVWELCWDWQGENYKELPDSNGLGAKRGSKRVMRGGSWEDMPYELRVSNRNGIAPFDRNTRNVGFRVARNAE